MLFDKYMIIFDILNHTPFKKNHERDLELLIFHFSQIKLLYSPTDLTSYQP